MDIIENDVLTKYQSTSLVVYHSNTIVYHDSAIVQLFLHIVTISKVGKMLISLTELLHGENILMKTLLSFPRDFGSTHNSTQLSSNRTCVLLLDSCFIYSTKLHNIMRREIINTVAKTYYTITINQETF